ncbi:hypothetical protein cand_030230 [Cryptosporidium andersoni]|uniref:Uncharacterized protein n=1 Tax=Cryptosporidium andersoni TaxID=117008 RepID=A0A1J4MND2_9CRYT|nr:hypothetical protein cand_030230 [Cryptosporidium andersoni]
MLKIFLLLAILFDVKYLLIPLCGALTPISSINEDIPDAELARLSQHVLPIISKRYGFEIYSDSIRMDSRSRCKSEVDFTNNRVARRGCYVGVYICNSSFHKQCLWMHKGYCQCSTMRDFWKIQECRISATRVPTGDSTYPYINVPIGECKTAIWIFALASVLSVIAIGLAIKMAISRYLKKKV